MTSQSALGKGHKVHHDAQLGCVIIVWGILAAAGVTVGYKKFGARKVVASALDSVVTVQEGIATHWREHQQLPTSLQETLLKTTPNMRNVSSVEWDSSGVLTIRFDSVIQDRMQIDDEPTVILKATVLDSAIEWDCSYGTVGRWYRPEHCRSEKR